MFVFCWTLHKMQFICSEKKNLNVNKQLGEKNSFGHSFFFVRWMYLLKFNISHSTLQVIKMNSKVFNILILFTMNFCCANSDIVSIVKSSATTISNWYDHYIKPLWTWTTTFITPSTSSVPPDADISFYEHEEGIKNSPSIQDENVVLMDLNENQVLLQCLYELSFSFFYFIFQTVRLSNMVFYVYLMLKMKIVWV